MADYKRCRNCGCEENGKSIVRCDSCGYIFCYGCVIVDHGIFSSKFRCPKCNEDGPSIIGEISSDNDTSYTSSSDSDITDIHNSASSYLAKNFDDNVASAYPKNSDLFETITALNMKALPSGTQKMIARYLYTRAFVAGWNARKK